MHYNCMLGPFSSAGAFIYGPQWFWIVMIMQFFYFPSIMTAWIGQGILYVAVIICGFFIGKEIKDTYLGLILAFLITISPEQIQQSINLTSPSMVGVFAFLCVYLFTLSIKYQKIWMLFLLSFFVATTINIHFQAIGLGVLLPIAFCFQKLSWKKLFALTIGFIIPFIPLILFDVRHHFYESKNWIYYYRYGQYVAYVPTRWVTYIFLFWPLLWGKMISGYRYLGYGIILLLGFFFLKRGSKKDIPKALIASFLSFFTIFILLRFYKGQRFDSYFIFVQPFIFLFTSWVIYHLWKIHKIIGASIMLFILLLAMSNNWNSIMTAKNTTIESVNTWQNYLHTSYPHSTFQIYSYHFSNSSLMLPFSLELDIHHLISDNGIKIGVMTATTSADMTKVIYNKDNIMLLNISSSTSGELKKADWYRVDPKDIYHAAEQWPEDEKI